MWCNWWTYARSYFIAFAVMSCAGGCSSPNYRTAAPGVSYKLLRFGGKQRQINRRDILELRWGSNSVEAKQVFVRADTLAANSGLVQLLPLIHPGDSMAIRLRGHFDLFSALPDSQATLIHASIAGAYEGETQMPMGVRGSYRLQKMLQRYMSSHATHPQPGVWMKPVITGRAERYRRGDEVLINYHGRSIYGSVQDTIFATGQPFRMFLGQEKLLIPGLSEAVKHMAPGGQYLVLLAPQMAFGLEHTRVNFVPPHTPMLYCVKAIDVRAKLNL